MIHMELQAPYCHFGKWAFKHETKIKRKIESGNLPGETTRKADTTQTRTRSKLNVLYRNQQWSEIWGES